MENLKKKEGIDMETAMNMQYNPEPIAPPIAHPMPPEPELVERLNVLHGEIIPFMREIQHRLHLLHERVGLKSPVVDAMPQQKEDWVGDPYISQISSCIGDLRAIAEYMNATLYELEHIL